jgi:hypothetical protein
LIAGLIEGEHGATILVKVAACLPLKSKIAEIRASQDFTTERPNSTPICEQISVATILQLSKFSPAMNEGSKARAQIGRNKI